MVGDGLKAWLKFHESMQFPHPVLALLNAEHFKGIPSARFENNALKVRVSAHNQVKKTFHGGCSFISGERPCNRDVTHLPVEVQTLRGQ